MTFKLFTWLFNILHFKISVIYSTLFIRGVVKGIYKVLRFLILRLLLADIVDERKTGVPIVAVHVLIVEGALHGLVAIEATTSLVERGEDHPKYYCPHYHYHYQTSRYGNVKFTSCRCIQSKEKVNSRLSTFTCFWFSPSNYTLVEPSFWSLQGDIWQNVIFVVELLVKLAWSAWALFWTSSRRKGRRWGRCRGWWLRSSRCLAGSGRWSPGRRLGRSSWNRLDEHFQSVLPFFVNSFKKRKMSQMRMWIILDINYNYFFNTGKSQVSTQGRCDVLPSSRFYQIVRTSYLSTTKLWNSFNLPKTVLFVLHIQLFINNQIM